MALSPVSETSSVEEADPVTRIPMDGYDRYLLPHPDDPDGPRRPWTRASTVKARMQNSGALKDWNERMILKGMAISPDLIALAAATPVSDRSTLDDVIEQAKVRAGARASSNFGTALHSFTERIDRGELDLDDPDAFERIPDSIRDDLLAYVAALREHGLTPAKEWIERTVVNTELNPGLTWDGQTSTRSNAAVGTAGTLDRAYWWTDPATGQRTLLIGDLKTGKGAIQFGALETCVQEATYANAGAAWDEETATLSPMPAELDRKRGLLIHLPVGQGRCEIVELDLELGWRTARLGVELLLLDKAKNHCHRPFGTDPAVSLPSLNVPAAPPAFPQPPPGSPSPAAPVDDATRLAPLAGPGQRGCSVCGRTGHRKGSPKCLGASDPVASRAPGTEAEAVADAGPPPVTDPVPVTDLAPVTDPVGGEYVPWCTRTGECSSAGWTRQAEHAGTDQEWVCGHCRRPAHPGSEETVTEPVVVSSPRVDPPASSVSPDPVEQEQNPEQVAWAVWSDRIRAVTTKTELREVRDRAQAAGQWTEALFALGKERLPELLP